MLINPTSKVILIIHSENAKLVLTVENVSETDMNSKLSRKEDPVSEHSKKRGKHLLDEVATCRSSET